jgi:hypothetical protein
VVQRLAHCAACYVWVADQLGNDTYLRYLPFTFTHLRAALAACAPAAPLSRVMASRWDTLASRAAAPLASAPLSRRRPDQPQGALARV